MMKYKAVLFDLGDVFFESHYWREWNYHELTKLGWFRGDFAEFYELYDSFLQEIYINKTHETYERTFIKFLLTLGFYDNVIFTAQSLAKKKEYEDNRVLYNGVKETLCYLQERGIITIIVTDNELSAEEIRTKVIAKYDINHFIDLIVTSEDVGVTKPNPSIYLSALEKYGFKTIDALFVGHDLDELEGAGTLGIATVEFNNYLERKIQTNYKIARFSELISIV
jgi:HAD superfamily hydrolase (TIGR01549 family)